MPLLPFFLKLTPIGLVHFHLATEIALVKDIAKSSRQFSILILLGESVAFVAAGHFLLLETLPSLGFPILYSRGLPLTSLATFQQPLIVFPQSPNSWKHPKCSPWASSLAIFTPSVTSSTHSFAYTSHANKSQMSISSRSLCPKFQIVISNCLLNFY